MSVEQELPMWALALTLEDAPTILAGLKLAADTMTQSLHEQEAAK